MRRPFVPVRLAFTPVCRLTLTFALLAVAASTAPVVAAAAADVSPPSPTTASPGGSAGARFEALARDYLDKYLAFNPEQATALGDHRYDGRLNDRTENGVQINRKLAKGTLKLLATIPAEELGAENRVDYDILRNNLESIVLETDKVQEWRWNPLNYNVGGAIFPLLSRDFAPLPERLRNVRRRLEMVPAAVAAAKTNLQHPPKIHVETALRQNVGTLNLVREGVDEFLAKAPPELRAELAPAQAVAVAALEEYGRFLKDDLLPRADGDFRLGDANFRARLRYSLESDLSKEEVLRRAQEELRRTQADMYATARPLFARFFPGRPDTDPKAVCKAVLDKLAESRPTDGTIVSNAEADLRQCTEFVRAHQLVTVPDEPVNILVMPEFQRGVAIAYCDAPGALAKNEATFFAIAPTPADWTPERKESFYREYNDYMLQDLTIHEAMPGHYLQLVLGNRFKAPTLVRGVFTSGMFAEGWATYAEQFMAAAGYGGPEVKMQQLKMRLRLIINALLDQGIHTAGMTEREAMALMTNEGFQEEGEAAGKWRRACLTAAQLSTYFVGNAEVNDLARDLRARHQGGSEMSPGDVRAMHDRMLTQGTVAPRYLRVLLGL